VIDALISPRYLQEQQRLHAQPNGYGGGGVRWRDFVTTLALVHRCRSVLDYGCGEGTLAAALKTPLDVRQYDPAMPAHAALPGPADLVVCTDVLEHVEPDRIEAVLAHLASLSQRVLFVAIALVPSNKTLSDGRNAHILMRPESWWLQALRALPFDPFDVQPHDSYASKHFVAVCVRRPS
jgi:hypothetical protein